MNRCYRLILILMLVVLGCTKQDSSKTDIKYPFTVLLLLPGSVEDNGWSRKGYQSIQRIGHDYKINTSYRENVTPSNLEQTVKAAMTDKPDFIIGLGGQFISPLIRSANNYPQIKFAVVSNYLGNSRNLGGLSFTSSYSYLAGAVAALYSKTNRIGCIVGDKLPGSSEDVNAFVAGAKRIKPDIRTYTMWVNFLDSEQIALKDAQALKLQNVDVMYVNCDKSDTALHAWAMKQNIHTIGTLNDQYPVAPPAVLTSVRVDLYRLLSLGIEPMLSGTWQGQNYTFGMLQGVCSLTSFRGKLNINQKKQFEDVYRELVLNKGEFRYSDYHE